jgi:hypothetical protein
MQPFIRVLAATLGLLLLLAARPARADAVRLDDVVAIVGDEPILRSEVVAKARLAKADQREVLDLVIDNALIVIDAYRLGIYVSGLEIAQAKERIGRKTGRALETAQVASELLELKWLALAVKPRVKMPVPVGAAPAAQEPFLRELAAERKRVLAELRKSIFVEVRW